MHGPLDTLPGVVGACVDNISDAVQVVVTVVIGYLSKFGRNRLQTISLDNKISSVHVLLHVVTGARAEPAPIIILCLLSSLSGDPSAF